MKEIIKNSSDIISPGFLARGDTIGLVFPSGPVVDQDAFAAGIRLLQDMGFQVKFNRELSLMKDGYLASSDEERADDINRLWADKEVKALLAVRGGYGSIRMVEMLDIELVQNDPKMFIGFSDITLLLNYIWKKTGLITYHGPVLTTLIKNDKKSVELFFENVTGKSAQSVKFENLEILSAGNTRGTLVGGNLTTLSHLIGTPYEVTMDGTVLFLEDIGEAPYRVDRMLTQLKAAGCFNCLKGILLGSFSKDSHLSDTVNYDEIVWARILELTAGIDIPIWGNVPVGHARSNYTLPIGGEVELDSDAGLLKILYPLSNKM